jgi:nitrite reductase/ring-hydroxylating ferredoxin subunit
MSTESDLASRTGPVLTDGTTLRDLVDFDRHEVSLRVLSDPEIHRLELRRIFARTWLFVATASEIPEPGDFVLRRMGEDAVIVTRRVDGEISILLNVCAHRGMEVCWADKGNQGTFKCPYHGWVFDNEGNLLAAPFEREMYGDWDKSGYGLRTAAVAVRHGLIFGNFDPNAIPFDEYLGDFASTFDKVCGGVGWEPGVGGLSRTLVDANWKITADNWSGDTYHGYTLHRSAMELGLGPPLDPAALDQLKVGFPRGHAVVAFDMAAYMGEPDPQRAPSPFEDRAQFIFLFPTTKFTGLKLPLPEVEGHVPRAGQVGGVNPSGAEQSVSFYTALADPATPQAFRETFARSGGDRQAAVEDVDPWESMQRGSRGAVGQGQTLKYNALAPASTGHGWDGPGTVFAGPGMAGEKDNAQWSFWMAWFEAMTS